MSDVLPDAAKNRHYLNVGRGATIFAACEDHAAFLLFATRTKRLPENDEHLKLAKFSDDLRKALKNEVDPSLAKDLACFSQYQDTPAHSVMRYDYVETEPDKNGFRLITAFENHRTVNPRTGTPMPILDDDEVEARQAEMNHWCRAVWVRAKEVSRHE